ncbi:RNA polymerase sigma factor [Planococcus sp. 1R117A]|uniref:RNA polymerase sigma factor n=1 Tax=Planococcus sp. 1R117A TaxID=3447020 RepID=UPI003EDC4F4E
METNELVLRAKAGDREAFSEWCWAKQALIGRFGFQNGISLNVVSAYQTAVFRDIYSLLGDIKLEDAEKSLWQTAIELLGEFTEKAMEPVKMEAIRFEEDQETHEAIQGMDEQQRIPFLLVNFYGKSLREVSGILGKPEQQIQENMVQANALLTDRLALQNDAQIEKRLEFMGKSYARIPFLLSESDLFVNEQQEEIQTDAMDADGKRPAAKRSTVLLALAGIAMAGVVGASFLFDDPNPNINSPASVEADETVTAKMVEQWRAKYNDIRASSPARLGVDPEVYEQFAFVKEADALMKRTFKESNIEKMGNDKKKMQRQVDKLLLAIDTPNGMAMGVQDVFLTGEENLEFLYGYGAKTKELLISAEQVLVQHEEALALVKFNGLLSAEKLLAQPKGLPVEVQSLLASLRERGLTVVKHPAEERFIVRRNLEALYSSDVMNQDYLANAYLNLLANDPYFDDKGLLLPSEQMTQILSHMELNLVEAKTSSRLYQEFAFIFQHSFFLLLKGTEDQTIFDSHGVVKEEYQQAWKTFSTQAGNPLLYLMLPIVEEMEASGWTSSKSYDNLTYEDIMEVMEMEKKGLLAEKLPNGDIVVEKELVEIEHYDFNVIAKLYKSFSAGHDKNLLKGLAPLDTLILFQYANQQEDPATMWHLMADEGTKPELENYLRFWRKQPDFFAGIRWIEAGPENMHRIGKNLELFPFLNYFEENGPMQYMPGLVTSGKDLWLVKYHLYESYDLEEKGQSFTKKVESLYAGFSADLEQDVLNVASPGEIGGMFLLAKEKDDFRTMSALYDNETQQAPEVLEVQIESRGVTGLSEANRVIFSMDSANYGFIPNTETGILYFENQQPGGNEPFNGNQLTMVKTEKGWKIGDLNMY